jgi:hypothetical protein
VHKLINTLSAAQREDVLAYLGRTLPIEQLESLTQRSKPRLNLIISSEFAEAKYAREWFVEDVLAKGQPAILGGPKKALNTGVSVDLAISLGSARPFLNRFKVPKAVRVAILSGESGEATIQETATRIAESRKLDLKQSAVFWGFKLPRFGDDEDLTELKNLVEHHRIEVLILDPMYLCLLAGGSDVDAKNMLEMGPALQRVTEVGCTPILVHHTRKLGERSAYHPLDLDDLAYTGFAEFARQWLLINRRSSYREGTGHHELWLKVGGSMGHNSLWGVDVDEGQLDTRFAGRTWDVNVKTGDEVREARQKQGSKDDDAVRDVVAALKDGPLTQTKLRDVLGWRTDRLKRVLELAITENALTLDGKKYARTEPLAA